MMIKLEVYNITERHWLLAFWAIPQQP